MCSELVKKITEREIAWILVSLGQRELFVIERCPYYIERNCMNFGVFGTKRTVCNKEVSIL